MAITQYGKERKIETLENRLRELQEEKAKNGISQEEAARREAAYEQWNSAMNGETETGGGSDSVDWQALAAQREQNDLMAKQNELAEQSVDAQNKIAKEEKKLRHQKTRHAIGKFALVSAGVSAFVGFKAAKGVLGGARKIVGGATNILKKAA